MDLNHKKLEASPRGLERGIDSVASTLGEEAMRLVKEHPGAVMLAALALGFVAGRLLSRR